MVDKVDKVFQADTPEGRSKIRQALVTQRGVLQRRLNAEKNAAIGNILQQDINYVDVLILEFSI